MKDQNTHRLNRRRLLCTTALAFTPLLPILLLGGPVSAQANCSVAGVNCALAQDQYQYLQSFANLPNTAAGQALLNNSLSTVINIYQNATTAQQNQAALNAYTGSLLPIHIWGMISNAPLTTTSPPVGSPLPSPTSSDLAINASSFRNGSAGAAFAPFATGVAATANLATAIATGNPAGLNNNINTLLGNIINNVTQIESMKMSFGSYNAQYNLGQATPWATFPYYGQSTITYGTFPASQDLRPYQLTSAIANAPWSSLPASQQPWAFAQAAQWTAGAGWQDSNWGGNENSPAFPSGHSTMGNTTALLYAMMVPQAYQSLMVSALEFGLSRNILGVHHPLDIIGGRILAYYSMTQLMAGNPAYANAANGTANFANTVSSYGNQINAALGSLAAVPYAQCAGSNLASCVGNGTFPTTSQLTAANQAYVLLATYGLQGPIPTNSTNTAPANSNLLIASRFPYLSSQQQLDVLTSTMMPAGVPLDDGSGWARLNLYAAAGGYGAFNNGMVTVNMNTAAGGFSAFDFWSNNISGTGGLTLQGTGTLVLGGNNTYTGGTVVGCAPGTATSACTPTLGLSGTLVGNLTTYPGATFVSGGGYSVSSSSTLTNGGTFQSVNSVLLNQGTLANSGLMITDLVNAGSATNNGTITGSVANFGALSGSGLIGGNLINAGTISPGNSGIGTLSVAGNYAQTAGGSHMVDVNGSGQSDLVNVGGTANLQGGSVYVYAQPGTTYSPVSTYKILNAVGGLSGTFASVNELYPFLLSSLSYDANNAYLTLQIGGFAAAAVNPIQYAVGTVLDANVTNATGDFAQVLSAMATNVVTDQAAQSVLQQLSGNNYAGLSSSMVQGAQLFMNNFAGQTGGTASLGGSRVAIAEACDVACDPNALPQWGAWGGGIGGFGTIGANAPVGGVTYNAGGFAAGLDRMITPSTRLGVTAGYTSGTQWVSGFAGQSKSDTFNVGLYGNYAQDKVYADALVGYAYSGNQMWRPISIPGLQPRTALGQTGANQFYGQLETGYRFDIGGIAQAFVTPFARLQAYTGTQNAFTETGAQSLNLSIAQQTTNSLRSVLGAQLGGAMDLGWREKLATQFRLGWSHEYADVGRPVTATLAGAPAMPFTTFGVSPQRDGIVLGLSASTAIADATSIYLRYEGNIAGQDSAQAITAGVRMTW
jgi:autotransporter-associated beta strand protein